MLAQQIAEMTQGQFTKEVIIDLIEVRKDCCVQVRTTTKVFEDGIEIGSNSSMHLIAPGDDYSLEQDRVKAICSAAHTTESIAAYKAAQIEI